MQSRVKESIAAAGRTVVPALGLLLLPALAFAQASPWSTGATSFQGSFLTFLTPFVVIVVMGMGVAAAFGRISWGWVVGGIVGIVLIFGAPQIIAWVRGLFGV